jgi:hypothetical protein
VQDPSIVPGVVAAVLILALAAVVLVVLALDRGPDPAETAATYEEAWDRLDFALLWRLSGPGMRDGRNQEDFVAAKREAYQDRTDLGGLVEHVSIERLDRAGGRARAVTRLRLRGGGDVTNEVRLGRHDGQWKVDDYRLGHR